MLKLKRLLNLILCLLLALPSACYMDVGRDTEFKPPSSGSGTSTSPITPSGSDPVVTEVGRALVKGMAGLIALSLFAAMVLFGCDVDSSATVALAFYTVVALDLLPSVDADAPLTLAPHMLSSAVAALDDPAFVLPAGKTKDEALAAIVEGAYKGVLTNSGYGLTLEEQTTLLASFAGAAMSGVDEGGLADATAAAAVIARTAVGSLDDAGVAADGVGAAGEAVMTALVGGFPDAGITDKDALAAAAEAATRAAVAALAAAGVSDAAAVDAAVQRLAKGATAGLAATGLEAADQRDLAQRIAAGAAQGMADAGHDATRIAAVGTAIEAGVAEGLQQNGLDADDVAAARDDAAQAIEDLAKTLGL